MLTIEDIRDPNTKSGFRYVKGDTRDISRPYRAQVGTGNTHGSRDANQPRRWEGPRRATAEESAQDYCDCINGSAQPPPRPELKSAGHKRVTKPSSPAVQEARRVLRDALAAEKAAQPEEPGWIYLAAESFSARASVYDNGWLVNSYAVKVGHSDSKPDEGRMGGLQTGNPRILVLLGTIRGTWDDEQAMHAKYIHDNVLHEWFLPSNELLAEFGVEARLAGNGCMWVDRQKEAA